MEKDEKIRTGRMLKDIINLYVLTHDGLYYDIGCDLASNICACIKELDNEIIRGVLDSFAEGL